MPSRPNIFRAVCAVIVLAGAGWIVLHHPGEIAATTVPRLLCAPDEDLRGTSAAVARRSAGLPLTQIGELLARQRELGPADRSLEDEIRGALLALLTDANAGNIVSALSIQEQQSEFGVAALARWAGTDLAAATLWLARQPAQSVEQTWVVSRLLAQDAIVLEVLCERLPAGPWREALLENASYAAQSDNCATAVLFAHCMQPGAGRTRALRRIADEWVLRDPVAATRWIAAESDSALRDELVFTAATARASTDPIGALEWTRAIASDVTFERAIGKVTAMWADYAPERARRFAVLRDQPDTPFPR